MNVLCIGFDIPGYHEVYNDFKAQSSLHDGDLIFFCPPFYYSYSNETHDGKTKYSETDSYRVKRDSLHWKHEIDSALNSGKTIVFILSKFDEFIVDSGKQDINGTGRNSRIINYVEDWNNYKCIVTKELKCIPTNGTKIKCTTSLFSEFYSQFKEFLSYKIYIDAKGMQTAFTTLNGEKILGGVLKVGSGNIIFLPYFDFKQKGFTKTEKGKETWSSEAEKKGKIFVDLLIKIVKYIKSDIEKTPPPEWVLSDEFTLDKEVELESELMQNELSIQQLQNKAELLKRSLEEVTSLKDLLFATGKQLENVVIRSLHILGYEAENYDDGKLELDQIIMSPESQRFIGECEGKDSKDIDITKFRQLIDSLNEDFARDEVNKRALGILFGNSQRLLPPVERTLDFTLKCKNAAERERVALIKTPDLYKVAKYLSENKDKRFQKKCRDAIMKQLGKVVVFPEVPLQRKTATNTVLPKVGLNNRNEAEEVIKHL